jgi:hypothetical protein
MILIIQLKSVIIQFNLRYMIYTQINFSFVVYDYEVWSYTMKEE